MEQYRPELGEFNELKTTEQCSTSGILYRGSETRRGSGLLNDITTLIPRDTSGAIETLRLSNISSPRSKFQAAGVAQESVNL